MNMNTQTDNTDIDKIIVELSGIYGDLSVKRLIVKHPGVDDDGLWFFSRSGNSINIQLESTFGNCPFLLETDKSNERINIVTVSRAIEILSKLLS
jgi:hypothetical protein